MLGFSVILEKNSLELNEVAVVKEDHWVKKWEFGCYFFSTYYTNISMTTLLTHTVAHSTKPSFMPKTNNQPSVVQKLSKMAKF